MEAEVLDVQRPLPGLAAHQVHVIAGELSSASAWSPPSTPSGGSEPARPTPAPMVLHAALREVLGPTALQSGSYNQSGYLRLDFPWRGALSPMVRSEIERRPTGPCAAICRLACAG